MKRPVEDFKDALVVAKLLQRKADGGQSFWGEALVELNAFNSFFAQAERKPNDAATLKKCVNGLNKNLKVFVWAKKALTKNAQDAFIAGTRELSKLAKDKTATAEALRDGIEHFKLALQEALDSAAPEHFAYEGIKVENGEHIADEMCRKVLSGIDFLKALFKKRGVDATLLKNAVSKIALVLHDDVGAANFDSRSRVLTMSVPVLLKHGAGRFLDTAAGEAVLHEFGHYIHLNYIKGEAAEAWNKPWEGLADLADPRNRSQRDNPDRKKKLDELEVVTDYGKTNEREDFAETFMMYMAIPEKLTPTAKFRMQRALSLSGLYGKPVLRLAAEDQAIVEHVVARAGAAVVPFKAKPGVPTEAISGRKYVLSTDGGPLGDREDDGDMGWMGRNDGDEGGARLINVPQSGSKFKYLWAYDTDRQYLAMWRVTDGNEKFGGSARSETARLVKLDKKGQLNRVTNAEFRKVEAEMRRRENDAMDAMKKYIEDNKDDAVRQIDKLVKEFYEHTVEAKLTRSLDAVEKGAVPIGFKPYGPGETDPDWKKRQVASHVFGQVWRQEMSLDKVEKYLASKGVDIREAGQSVDWAIQDLYEAVVDGFLPPRPY